MKKLLSVLFILSIAFYGFSQPWMQNIPEEKVNNNEVDFYDIQKAFNEYWEGREIEKGKGWKQFKRWEWFMEPRVNPDGKIQNHAVWFEYQKEKQRKDYSTLKSNWQHLGPYDIPYDMYENDPSGMGRLNTIAFHPTDENTFWVGAPSGGFWKTTDGGANWSTTTDQLAAIGVSDIAVNPDNTNEIYIVTGDGDAGDAYSIGILKSTDAGESWTTLLDMDVTARDYFRRILMNPGNPDVMIASSNTGIYYTDDAWQNYSVVESGHFKDLEFKPGDPTVVYASTYNYYGNANIYKSTDSGESWSLSSDGLATGNANRIELAVTPADPNVVYALFSKSGDSGFGGLYMSDDEGETWTEVTSSSYKNLLGWDTNGGDSGGQGWYDLSLAVSPEDADEVYVGGVNVWKTADGGSSWDLVGHWYGGGGADYVHADIHMMAYSPFGDLFAANDGGLYITQDGGENWDDLSDGLHILQIYRLGSSVQDSNVVLVGNQDNGTFKRNGENWNSIYGGDGMECMVDHTNPNTLYATVYYGRLSRSDNGGYSFYDVTPNASGAWVAPFDMHPEDSYTIIGGYDDVYKTTNGGVSWTKLSNNLTGGSNLQSITFAPSNSNVIYTATYNNIWKTTNGGDSWTNISFATPNLSITDIEVSATDHNMLWVTLSGYNSTQKAYISTDGGENWTNYSTGLPNVPANCILYQKYSFNALYLGTDIGVYYRDHEMDSWVPFSEGLPNVIVNELEIHYASGKIRAATYGRGLWETDIVSTENAGPFPDFVATNTTLKRYETTHFQDASMNNPTSWSWTFEGATPSTSDEQHPTNIQYNTTGIFDVFLEVSNENGSNSIVRQGYITVLPAIEAEFSVEITNGDAPYAVQFTDNSTGGATSWNWDFGDGNSSTDQNPVNTYMAPGWYDVSLTIGDDMDEVTMTKYNYISVNSSITAEFTGSPITGPLPLTVNFSDLSTGDVNNWLWDFGDGSSSEEQNPTHTYQESGQFTVELIAGNDYYNENEKKTAFIEIWPSSADDVETEKLVNIYPNPSEGIFTLEILDKERDYRMEVFSLDGRIIVSKNLAEENTQKTDINLADQPKGTYILKLVSDDKIKMLKLMLE